MGDIADLVKDIQAGANGPGGAVEALDFLEGAVSTVANISSVFTVLQSIPALQDLLGSQSTTIRQSDISEILKKFSELFDALAAIEESNRNIQITEQLGQSRSQLRPISEDEPPDFGGNRANMDTFTSNVLETFKPDSDLWTRLFLREFVYRDDWAGELEPDHPGLQVFEYVQMLPPFVEAIFNRLCVLRARFDDFPDHKGVPEELSEVATSLRHFHDKIEDGIVMERPPTIPEITYRPSGGQGGVIFSSAWDMPVEVPIGAVPPFGFRNFGVVQIYTGVASIGRYPDDRFPDQARATEPIFPSVEFENDYKRFLAKHAVATAARFKHLYSDIGLSATWKTIIHLKRLAGASIGVVERLDTGSFWSLREVNRLVKQNLGIFSPRATVSLKKLMVLLDVKTPVFNLISPESDISRPVSVKGMLEVDAT
jgi:hypothetical protein